MTDKPQIGFWAHIATQVTCSKSPDHVFYLPYTMTINTQSIFCPYCKDYFPVSKGDFGTNDIMPYAKKLTSILDALPPKKKKELHALLDEWAETT